MIINIPIIEESFEEQSKQYKQAKVQMAVDLDTSFLAHQKWAEQFEPTMGIDLMTYTERMARQLDKASTDTGVFLSLLKLLYCYINSPKLSTFNEFLRLFKPNNAIEVVEKITVVLNEVNKSMNPLKN